MPMNNISLEIDQPTLRLVRREDKEMHSALHHVYVDHLLRP